jgi:hypothetical protein
MATEMPDLAALFIDGRARARAALCGAEAAIKAAGMSTVSRASSA